jgi:5'-phosphate synthase pdxT subunit
MKRQAKIGLLALQGDYAAHGAMLECCGAEVLEVRTAGELASAAGLVIPGGESTTMIKLMLKFGLFDAVKTAITNGLPVLGTCAGAILLAGKIMNRDQVSLGVLDIDIERNAYGRQIDSFEIDLALTFSPDPIRGIFIRAPIIRRTGPGVEILSRIEDTPVLVRQKNVLAATFHPEITAVTAIHEYFIGMIG